MANTITIGTDSDLQVQIPVQGTFIWASIFREEFVRKIVEHNHSGAAGQGRRLGAGSLDANIVTDSEIRLRNNEYLRARNAADDGDVNLLRLNSLDVIEIAQDLGLVSIEVVDADPSNPKEGQLQVSDGTHRPAGIYTYVGGSWLASPNNITVSNQGTGEGLFIQKTGDDLEFKSLTVSGDLNITPASDSINISTKPYSGSQTIEKTGSTSGLNISSLINEGTQVLTLEDNASASGTNFFGIGSDLTYLKEGDSLFVKLISNNPLSTSLGFILTTAGGKDKGQIYIDSGGGVTEGIIEIKKIDGEPEIMTESIVEGGAYPSRTSNGVIGGIGGLNQGELIDIEVDYELFASSGEASFDIVMDSGALEIGIKRISVSNGVLDTVTTIKNITIANPNTTIELRAANLGSGDIVTVRKLKITKKPRIKSISVAFFI